MKYKYGVFFMAVCLLLAVAAPTKVKATNGLPSDSETLYSGIDISQWQGNIDFTRVYNSGVRIVYIRAGQGSSYKDPYFERSYINAKKAGLKVGSYLYVTAKNESQSRQQAQYFAALLEGKAWDCRPAMDFEDLGGFTDAQVQRIARTFLESLEEFSGLSPIIYSDISNARRLSCAFGAYPLWVAEYGVQTVADPYYWEGWSGWQYTDSGQIMGIRGNVDRNWFTDTVFVKDENAKPQIPEIEPLTYTVVDGDTLWDIAIRYGTTVKALVQANEIKNPDLIYTGELLRIP